MICDRCQQIAARLQSGRLSPGPAGSFYLHSNGQSLLSSVHGGCPICIQIHGIFTGGRWQSQEPNNPAAMAKIRVECGSST
jgi:hypothetical protein